MIMKRNSYYDIDKIFLRGLTVRDIAEPLPSFDAETSVEQVRSVMKHEHIQVAGVRENGYVAAYLEISDLGEVGPCGQYCHPINEATILAESAPLSDLVLALNKVPYLFVVFLGEISGIVTRSDLDDPPVRMWLFGLITLIEMRFLTLIKLNLKGDSWQKYLSNSRLEKAASLQTERRRRNQDPHLLDCLQFSDKGQIIIRDENLRNQIGFASRRRGSEAVKNLGKLRNNLAHAQDIVSLDWETIVTISENLEAVVRIGLGEE
jgi:CBS domain-containing protein